MLISSLLSVHSAGCASAPTGIPSVTGSGPLSFANTGILTKYPKGALIEVKVQVTAYHGGKFEFRVQDIGDKTDPDGAKWSNLDPLPVVSFSPVCQGCAVESCAPTTAKEGTCAQIPLSHPGGDCAYDCNEPYSIQVRLPPDLVCEHCVLQWHWTSSNSCDGSIACASSEQFW
jgi:hypothetical protein